MDKLLQTSFDFSNKKVYKQRCNEEIEHLRNCMGIKRKIQFFEMARRNECLQWADSSAMYWNLAEMRNFDDILKI